jgi:hypothetical protein
MVVTASLARGALRAAVERQSQTMGVFLERMQQAGVRSPSTARRFGAWVKERQSLHERNALLILHGMVRRRSIGFAAFHPTFSERPGGWAMGILAFRIAVSPRRVESHHVQELPVEISGHALERIFQRTNEIQWNVVRDYLATATAFTNAVAGAYVASGCLQCAIPADRGLLVGQIEDRRLKLRTFLPEGDLGLRWQRLSDGLLDFEEAHRNSIHAAGITNDETVAPSFGQFLRQGHFSWLFRPYVPGEDPYQEAWRSRTKPAETKSVEIA